MQPLLTVNQTADVLGIERSQLYKLMQSGQCPPWLYVGKVRRFRPEDVSAWMESKKGQPAKGL